MFWRRIISKPLSPRQHFSAVVGRVIRRGIKILAACIILAIAGLALLFALLWREHKTEITLPEPTGHFAVGRTTYSWVNDAETDELAPTPGAKREVMTWIWYPSVAASSAPPAEYLPAAWRAAETQHSGILMAKFLTRDSSVVRTHSAADAEVSLEQRSYPVVIMRAGGGALTTDFTTLAEDLASHGYIVAGFDAPYRTSVFVFPDNRVVQRRAENDPENLPADQANLLINRLLPMWTSDTTFVVNQLEHLNADDSSGKFTCRLDMQRLRLFRYSFGGATTLQFCHADLRCKAGIDIDGAPYGNVIQEGLQQPFMFILSDHSREMSDSASRQILADIESIYNRLPGGRLLITISRANHISFNYQILF